MGGHYERSIVDGVPVIKQEGHFLEGPYILPNRTPDARMRRSAQAKQGSLVWRCGYLWRLSTALHLVMHRRGVIRDL